MQLAKSGLECLFIAALVVASSMWAAGGWQGQDVQSQKAAAPKSTLLFQTDRPWSPRTNINADTVMVYGIDDTVAQRIESWRSHGYHTTVMTGVAWGRYAPYLRGDFDGKQHWNETQQEKDGTLRLHSGREVPYISPTQSYGRYLIQGVEVALEAGAEAIYLEEPEFWANTGWSESFQQEWQEFYHEPWRAPDSSTDAQYRASKLKYFLYRRTLAQVFEAVKAYGAEHSRTIPCYVATHSLINYAQWSIVSPESSLLEVGADGYVAQVWTGTAREPNVYQGIRRERTFETAFLEYGALQSLARASGKPIWYLNDPIEDNPNHSWTDYRRNWESTLVASLLQPAVARYEVLPWPDRIFGPKALRPSEEPTGSNPKPVKTVIPKAYETELQTVFRALGEMNQPIGSTRWERAGTQGIGVLVSDTLMFERAEPQPSDKNLGNFYGLALPLLMRGIPVEPVQIESASGGREAASFLRNYRILLLTYEGQKPPSPELHKALTAWVRSGGALIVIDDDKDPYNRATDWWNSRGMTFSTPREHLFQVLGLGANANEVNRIGRGCVLYLRQSPSALSYEKAGGDEVRRLVQRAAATIHLPLKETNELVLRRGPYVIAAGLEQDSQSTSEARSEAPVQMLVKGDLINLFDANLAESQQVAVDPGTRALLLDVDYFKTSKPRILAASAKISNEKVEANQLAFEAEGIDETEAVVRILSARAPRSVSVNGKPLDRDHYQQSGRTLLLRFTNLAKPQPVRVTF